MECNTYACDFDGTDCSYGSPIYQNCSAIRFGIYCYDLFNNGRCDRACNSPDCLNDGWDCDRASCGIYDGYCANHYADGHCDTGCNVPECAWDGLDCATQRRFADGSLVVVILVMPSEFQQQRTSFLRQLGELLHSVVVVEQDSSGNDMIYPWSSGSATVSRSRRSITDHVSEWLHRVKRTSSTVG